MIECSVSMNKVKEFIAILIQWNSIQMYKRISLSGFIGLHNAKTACIATLILPTIRYSSRSSLFLPIGEMK